MKASLTPRILYLVPDLFGPPSGIARYCRMVCRALTESGHRITAISLLDNSQARREARSTLPDLDYRPCGGRRSVFVQRALRAMRLRPDLILIGHPHFSYLGWLLSKLTGAPYVVFVYGVDVWAPLSPSRRWGLQKADSVIAISCFTAERAEEANGVDADGIHILYNCLDPRFVRPPGFNKPVQRSLLSVGRLIIDEQSKGLDYVIRAMPALLKKYPDLVYNVVGDGDNRKILEALAAQEGVSQAVCFHGFVSDEEVARRYGEASIFIMPSRREGFGFVFIEAMTYGTPAIGGNVDATPEVIVNGETGYTVDPTSVDEIISAVSSLLDDGALRERMGQAAARHVEEKFGFPRFKQTLLSYLAELAE
jgi:phosphatidylinositol alpha-1,6-mannosyltransferase